MAVSATVLGLCLLLQIQNEVADDIKQRLEKSDFIMGETFDCFDREIKTELKEQIRTTTSGSVVTAAAYNCKSLRSSYVNNMIEGNYGVLLSRAEERVENW